MLNYLKIKNLALIENAEVEFAPGFNVVTGESGSGKTVLLNTIALLTGRRADKNLLRAGCQRCELSAEITVDSERNPEIIAELEEELFTRDEYQKHIAELKARLNAATRDASTGMITAEFVAQYIDKIFVTITDNDKAKLDIKIFTGKNTEKWFSRLNARSKGRTGHTLKKMIESYENSIQAK